MADSEDLGGLGLAPLGGGLLVVGVAEDLGGWLPLGGALVESLRSEILWDLGPSNPYPRRLNAGSFVGADLG